MSYIGKEFTLERQENFDGFLKALGSGISDDQIKAFIAHKPTAKLSKNGDTFTLTTTRPNNESSVVSFKLGTEIDEQVTGTKAKTTFTMDGDTLTQVQKFPQNGVTLTFKREFSDNEMIATCTSSVWDGVARRYYKA